MTSSVPWYRRSSLAAVVRWWGAVGGVVVLWLVVLLFWLLSIWFKCPWITSAGYTKPLGTNPSWPSDLTIQYQSGSSRFRTVTNSPLSTLTSFSSLAMNVYSTINLPDGSCKIKNYIFNNTLVLYKQSIVILCIKGFKVVVTNYTWSRSVFFLDWLRTTLYHMKRNSQNVLLNSAALNMSGLLGLQTYICGNC